MPTSSKGGNIASAKSKWMFSLLWINLAVLLAVLIATVGNQVSTVRDLLHVLAYALCLRKPNRSSRYLGVGGLAERLDLRRFPWSLR